MIRGLILEEEKSYSEEEKFVSIMWHDLTVENAEKVSDFYQQVMGWEKEGLSNMRIKNLSPGLSSQKTGIPVSR